MDIVQWIYSLAIDRNSVIFVSMPAVTLESAAMTKFNAARIKELRKQAKLRQARAAERGGITQGQWSAIESGMNKNPTLDVMDRIAMVLGCKLSDLLVETKGKRR